MFSSTGRGHLGRHLAGKHNSSFLPAPGDSRCQMSRKPSSQTLPQFPSVAGSFTVVPSSPGQARAPAWAARGSLQPPGSPGHPWAGTRGPAPSQLTVASTSPGQPQREPGPRTPGPVPRRGPSAHTVHVQQLTPGDNSPWAEAGRNAPSRNWASILHKEKNGAGTSHRWAQHPSAPVSDSRGLLTLTYQQAEPAPMERGPDIASVNPQS